MYINGMNANRGGDMREKLIRAEVTDPQAMQQFYCFIKGEVSR